MRRDLDYDETVSDSTVDEIDCGSQGGTFESDIAAAPPAPARPYLCKGKSNCVVVHANLDGFTCDPSTDYLCAMI